MFRAFQRYWKIRRGDRALASRMTELFSQSSGVGSTVDDTAALRDRLAALFRERGVRSFLDLPCGDFAWMQKVNLEGIEYIGADIIRSLIEAHQRRFAKDGRSFIVADLTEDTLPKVDLIFCRDCLVHLSDALVWKALGNIRQSGAKWLLATTFPGRQNGRGIVTGSWRPLNLSAAPFLLPQPVVLLNEDYTAEPGFSDKSLGLWRVEDIPARH